MDSTTHASLLERVADGVDPAAWAEFHGRYRELIQGVAARYGLQSADRDDVTQDVCLALSKSLSRFVYDPAKGKFRSYLRTVVINTIFRKQRQERPACGLPDDVEDVRCDTGSAADATWEDEWQQYHVRRAMRRLMTTTSARDRIAFVRYALRGAPAAETAAELELTVDQLYQIKSRILRRLSHFITEQVEEEG